VRKVCRSIVVSGEAVYKTWLDIAPLLSTMLERSDMSHEQIMVLFMRVKILTVSLDKKKAAEAAEQAKLLKRPAANLPTELSQRPAKTTRGAGLKSTNASAAGVIPDEYLPPNKILFAQNLPDGYDIDALTAIFGRFEGFKEVRLVPGRKGIAFVEYEAEAGAIIAKENVAGMTLGPEGQVMKVTYQRQ